MCSTPTQLTTGAHHVGLTVLDIEEARGFFCDTLGYNTVGGVPDYPAHFVSDGSTLITLWQVEDPASAVRFDRKRNVGLHHLALGVPDDAALESLAERFRARGDVEIEFGPGPMGAGMTTRHMIAIIPGGIRVEFATPFA